MSRYSGKAHFAERQPRRRRRQIIPQQLDLAGQRRRDREAAMADDLGGDALADLALGLGIDRQREIGMRLDVDEARRDGEAGGVDGLFRAGLRVAGRWRRCGRPRWRDRPARRRCRCRRTGGPPRIRMSCTENGPRMGSAKAPDVDFGISTGSRAAMAPQSDQARNRGDFIWNAAGPKGQRGL